MVETGGLEELERWSESPTNADAILSALAAIWREAGRPRSHRDGRRDQSGVIVRTRVANLIVCAATQEDAVRAAAVLGEVALRHPVRSLLLSPGVETASDSLGATIRVYCHPSMGRRVCFEHIHLSTGARSGRQLPSAVSQLLVHDLPTLVWWPGASPFGKPLFSRLAELADLLVFDSGGFPAPAKGLAALADAVRPLQGQTAVADLNWNRLADWRELIAQFFDLPDARPALDEIRTVEIEVAGRAGREASAQALLLVGWLGSRLGWRAGATRRTRRGLILRMRAGGAPIGVRLIPGRSRARPAGAVCAVRTDAGARGTAHRFCLESDPDAGHGTATTELGEGCSNRRSFILQQRSEAELLAEELETLGREHALDDALDFAGQIAARLLS